MIEGELIPTSHFGIRFASFSPCRFCRCRCRQNPNSHQAERTNFLGTVELLLLWPEWMWNNKMILPPHLSCQPSTDDATYSPPTNRTNEEKDHSKSGWMDSYKYKTWTILFRSGIVLLFFPFFYSIIIHTDMRWWSFGLSSHSTQGRGAEWTNDDDDWAVDVEQQKALSNKERILLWTGAVVGGEWWCGCNGSSLSSSRRLLCLGWCLSSSSSSSSFVRTVNIVLARAQQKVERNSVVDYVQICGLRLMYSQLWVRTYLFSMPLYDYKQCDAIHVELDNRMGHTINGLREGKLLNVRKEWVEEKEKLQR